VRFLLDTCILSEVHRPSGSPSVKKFIAQIDDENMFVSALSLGEIIKGTELLPAWNKKSAFKSWLSRMEIEFGERLLPVNNEIVIVWGAVTARLQKTGIILPAVDGLIAATALHHGMHLVTRSTRQVEATGALMLDPWQSQVT
jgi:toxin FitB